MQETVSFLLNGKRTNDLVSLKGIGECPLLCTLQVLVVISIQNLNLEILFHVVPDQCISMEVIIGQDLLRYDIIVSFSNMGFVINRQQVVNICNLDSEVVDFEKINIGIEHKSQLITLLKEFV